MTNNLATTALTHTKAISLLDMAFFELNVTAVTYHTGLQIAFLGLAAHMPDIQKLADYTESAFVELRAWRARR